MLEEKEYPHDFCWTQLQDNDHIKNLNLLSQDKFHDLVSLVTAVMPHMSFHTALGIFAINASNSTTHFSPVGHQLNISK